MYGWYIDSIEKMILFKFGINIWHQIIRKAKSEVTLPGSWMRHTYYEDSVFFDFVQAAAEVLDMEADIVLELFGKYFMEHCCNTGYEYMLRCLGNSLRDWLSNLNDLHNHFVETLIDCKMIEPAFWCIDDIDEDEKEGAEQDGALILHYFSQRGSVMAPFVVGIVKQAAQYLFSLVIVMTRIATQGVNDSEFTTWRMFRTGLCSEFQNLKTRGNFTSLPKRYKSLERKSSTARSVLSSFDEETSIYNTEVAKKCPFSAATNPSNSFYEVNSKSFDDRSIRNGNKIAGIGLSSVQLQDIHPYHIAFNAVFDIVQVGSKLETFLETNNLVGQNMINLFEITEPIKCYWNWESINLNPDNQRFTLKLNRRIERSKFFAVLRGGLSKLHSPFVGLCLVTPYVASITEMYDMGLTSLDLPAHTFIRDVMRMGEHLNSEMHAAHQLDTIRVELEKEKHLSNSLLERMLPRKVAQDLRTGQAVAPEFFNDVTIFFSDIVGFTRISSEVPPIDVVNMLNHLYIIMDHFASVFDLYKVETIGDAYMACAGVPNPDPNHAINIANFAVVVQHAIKQIKSPLDGNPISVRVGIHSGSVMAGVVGNLMPSYCLFGDTVNTASHHEATGEAGKIHCSDITAQLLIESGKFNLTERGLVDMKGKGGLRTYWLDDAHIDNMDANQEAIERIVEKSEDLIKSAKHPVYLKLIPGAV